MTATVALPTAPDTGAEIRAILPHRSTFLLVDRVVDSDESHIRCLKHVTHTEPALAGHFPDEPLFPGVLIIEACAQAGGILLARTGRARGRGYLAQIGDFKFTQPVVPGDTLVLHAEFVGRAGPFTRVAVHANVGDDVGAKGLLTYFFAGRPRARAGEPGL
jgi:3-hydroxyacyl-[acyl-carrier-protein] dehydratase